jgi:hypothetical protein
MIDLFFARILWIVSCSLAMPLMVE